MFVASKNTSPSQPCLASYELQLFACPTGAAQVGVLVAKTLANASANPFIASAAGVYNPVLALDVFLVQVGMRATEVYY
jgi:hypothetical protein